MEKVKIKNIFDFQKKSKIKAGDGFKLGEAQYPFYTSSNELTKSINEYLFEDESLIFGTGGLASIHFCNEKFAVSTDCFVIQPKDKKRVFSKFVYYYLSGNMNILENGFKGAGLKHISKDYLENIEIPLPNLATQQRIAAILDQADAIIQNNRAIVQKYDALTQSLFLDMFGDPVKNEKGWEKITLGKLGDFKNGLNYSKSDNGFSLKVIGVGDFKNFSRLDDFSNISIIEMNEAPRDEFLLKDGDLLFVRSNGNKELVGRCLIVYVGDEKISYSGFCIRLRLNSNQINSNYLVQLLQRAEFKKHIFKNGRGANIQNINQELLNKIEIQIPPLSLQTEYANRIAKIEEQKKLTQEELAKSEELFQSLLQRAFKGELN